MEPTSQSYAIIDLGTNTFHLLIVALDASRQLREISRERRFVKLAEGGIEQIATAPYARGLAVLHEYRNILDEHQVTATHLTALGTAALRTATNGPDFIHDALQQTGITIDLIPGDREALLIYEGVRHAVLPDEEGMLIMDIGGGSVEFILANIQGVRWSQSFPIGVAVLYRRFHQHDPISTDEIHAVRAFLQEALTPLQQALRQYPCHRLVGASGTFDVLEYFLCTGRPGPNWAVVDLERFPSLYQQLVHSTLEERKGMEGLPLDRVDMIVVALILVQVVIEIAGITRMDVSAYAMKEGMLYELMRR
ncbi:MAG TPA: hypothetical protein PKA00_23680 [Saprospiraceae bacterium]|nr:hypothetical protein [Saprospiraceae bacterium]HMQ85931.1 hypothetical protein [Saprospiraceae bacterium]